MTRDFKLAGGWTMALSGGGGTSAGAGALATGSGGLLDLKLAYGGKDPAFSWGDAKKPSEGRALIVEKLAVEGSLIGAAAGLDPDKSDARAVLRVEKGKSYSARPETRS